MPYNTGIKSDYDLPILLCIMQLRLPHGNGSRCYHGTGMSNWTTHVEASPTSGVDFTLEHPFTHLPVITLRLIDCRL